MMTFGKIDELKNYIGDTFSDNFSSTLRSRLIKLIEDENGISCLIQEAPSPYYKHKPKPDYKLVSGNYVYTCFFGV